MSTKPQGKATTRKRTVARDLTARKTTRLTGGIIYNGHAGLGANAVLAGAVRARSAPSGIVTNNNDPDKM